MPNRREFLIGAAMSAVAANFAFAREAGLPLAFSTLGCPGWEWAHILEFASTHGFAAIELRGVHGDLNLPSRPEFSPQNLAQSKREVESHGLKIANLGSSSEMHESDPEKRAKQMDDARRFIDLAAALECPYVRIFGNNINGPRDEVVARVADGMHELAVYAAPRHVTVIIESHGDFTDSKTLKEILARADSDHAALLWDAHHTFASSHEQPEFTVEQLGKWIRHTHLKDSVPDTKDRRYVLPGTGDVPMKRQVEALVKLGYKGYYCFEWEKLWHPEIGEPEVAFPEYVKVVGKYLTEALQKSVK